MAIDKKINPEKWIISNDIYVKRVLIKKKKYNRMKLYIHLLCWRKLDDEYKNWNENGKLQYYMKWQVH